MTPAWGRKRCSRRLCPPPLCVPMPRPCLDSLRIPKLRPCALHRPRTDFVRRCVQPSCCIKHPICHCADNNYCTAETCSNSTSCKKTQSIFCPNSLKENKDEDSVCNGPCRQQGDETNDVEDFERDEPACNEASCERLQNCGVGEPSDDEELVPPVAYTPSVTNQNAVNRMPPIVPSKQIFDHNIPRETNHINNSLSTVAFAGRGMTPKPNNFNGVNKLSNINRCIQINMQNETVSRRGRNAESSVAPEACCSGNEVPDSPSTSGSYIKPVTEKYDTNAHSYNQSPNLKSQLNISSGGYSRDNVISLTDVNDQNKVAVNPCCKYSSDLPASFEPKSQEQFTYPNAEIDDQRFCDLSQQNSKQTSEQSENTFNGKYMSTMQSVQQTSGINKEHIRIRDSEYIPPQGSVQANSVPSTPRINENVSNELAHRPANISTNQRLLNKNEDQFIKIANDCCVSGNAQINVEPSEFNQKPQYMSPSAIQDTRSHTKQSDGSQASHLRFHDNNMNNVGYRSPIQNQSPKYNSQQSSILQMNDNVQDIRTPPINSASEQKYGAGCDGCKRGCFAHDGRQLPVYKPPPDLDCVCSDEGKRKRKNRNMKCEKKPCVIEDGTSSCASTTCVVNQDVGCTCHYPPAFKLFSCTGNISGICNCNDKK